MQPDPIKPDPVKPDPVKADPVKADPIKADPIKADPVKPDPIRLEGTVLGFDVGARRIGVAVGSVFGHGARALAVIDVHANGPDWNAIDRLRKEWRPDGLVLATR